MAEALDKGREHAPNHSVAYTYFNELMYEEIFVHVYDFSMNEQKLRR